jgi:hypothetical protein
MKKRGRTHTDRGRAETLFERSPAGLKKGPGPFFRRGYRARFGDSGTIAVSDTAFSSCGYLSQGDTPQREFDGWTHVDMLPGGMVQIHLR